MRHTSTQNFQQEEYSQNSSFKRMNMSSTPSDFKSIKESGRSSPSPFKLLATSWSKSSMLNAWEPDKAKRKQRTYTSMVRGTEISFAPNNIKRFLKLRKDPIPNAPSYHERKANEDFRIDHILYDMCKEGAEWVLERAMLIHSIIIRENINVEEIIAEQIYKFVYKTDISSSFPFPSIIATLYADAKILAIPDDTLIPQEPPIVAEAMARIRESRAKNPRQTRQITPPQQPQVQHQEEFPAGFYTHFDTSISQIHRKLDQHQEENRRSFEAINTRMNQMDDQLSFLCYSNQMADE
ncbi:hypothetical protein PIB30_095400 [Stylosanthes scabra]|uniref:Uncharacterized protein n=1 Tax=Stylosanthes scabra TaxID=79078 RepID=A0ABU6UUJ0_9FABA|nr:hypothetical protein [Stylosanthes scabra]